MRSFKNLLLHDEIFLFISIFHIYFVWVLLNTMVRVWGSEDNLWQPVLSYHRVVYVSQSSSLAAGAFAL